MDGWSMELGTKTIKTTQEFANKPGCFTQVSIQSLLQTGPIRKPPTLATSRHGFLEAKHGHPLKMYFFMNIHCTKTFVTFQNHASVYCKYISLDTSTSKTSIIFTKVNI